MMAPRDTLVTRLKALRAERGWSQKVLAELAGISHGYLSRLEIARQDPSLKVLEKLAAAFGVTVGELLGERPMKPMKRRRKR
jgi:transcriptional regulator with XRE-family HTH domain